MRTIGEGLGLLSQRLMAGLDEPNLLLYSPHEAQVDFHTSPAQARLFIGGNRSGKTTAGCCEGLFRARGVHPYQAVPSAPTRGRIVAVDYPNGHEQIVLPKLRQWMVPSDLINGSWEDSYSTSEREITLANGSTIQLSSADSELKKHAGTSRHWVWIDEEIAKPYWTENRARIIDVRGVIFMTMTAVDGQTWSYTDLYVPGLGLETAPRNPKIHVTQVRMDDNPYLPAGEVTDFLDGLDEEDKASRVRGEYAAAGGLIYKAFSRDRHVIEPMLPPPEWPIYCSMDHGLNAPTHWLWHTVTPNGRVITFHEEVGAEITVPQWAERVLRYEEKIRRIPEYRVGDPSIRNRQQAGGAVVSIQGEYAKAGVFIQLGNNDVPAGINRVKAYLSPRGPGGVLLAPMLQTTSDCKELIRQKTRYRWRTPVSARTKERVNPFEEPVKKDDHGPDAERYFVMSRPDLSTLAPSPPLQGAPTFPDAPVQTSPWGRVVPVPARSGRDPDTLSPQEWEINEHIGGLW